MAQAVTVGVVPWFHLAVVSQRTSASYPGRSLPWPSTEAKSAFLWQDLERPSCAQPGGPGRAVRRGRI